MKIAFGLSDVGACGYYRCVVPGLELRRRGHDVRFHLLADRKDLTPTQLVLMNRMPEYAVPFYGEPEDRADVFIGQRISDPRFGSLMADFRIDGGVVLTDIDDNLIETPNGNPVSDHFGNNKIATNVLLATMQLSNLVAVSTQNLADRYGEFGQTLVVENALDTPEFTKYADREITGAAKREGQIRVGWFGSMTHRNDLGMVVKPLTKLLREFPEMRLVLFGDNVIGFFPTDVREQIEFAAPVSFSDRAQEGIDRGTGAQINQQTFYAALNELDFDIGIAPLTSTVFNGGKSFVKVLEYGMMGIPVVASRVGPYADYERRGGPILTASEDPREWAGRLKGLLSSDARAELARKNRRYIGENHLVGSRIEAYEKALESLVTLVRSNHVGQRPEYEPAGSQ